MSPDRDVSEIVDRVRQEIAPEPTPEQIEELKALDERCQSSVTGMKLITPILQDLRKEHQRLLVDINVLEEFLYSLSRYEGYEPQSTGEPKWMDTMRMAVASMELIRSYEYMDCHEKELMYIEIARNFVRIISAWSPSAPNPEGS